VKKFGLFHSTALEDTVEKKANRLKSIEFIQENGVEKFASLLIPGLLSPLNENRFVSVKNDLIRKSRSIEQDTIITYTMAMMNRKERLQLLKDDTTKKLFIAGEDDIAVPLEASIRQIDLMQNGRSTILEKVGHMGMYEAPKECQQLILDFLLD